MREECCCIRCSCPIWIDGGYGEFERYAKSRVLKKLFDLKIGVMMRIGTLLGMHLYFVNLGHFNNLL